MTDDVVAVVPLDEDGDLGWVRPPPDDCAGDGVAVREGGNSNSNIVFLS